MLERNLLMLLSHGFRDIVMAVSAEETDLIAFARGPATRLAGAGEATLNVFLEPRPLGTIGAARAVGAGAGSLLVVNVDNLTALDLTAFLTHHNRTKAAMTIATHCEPFPVPFGQVSIRRGRITEYKEKPVLPVLLSSGTYVLSPEGRRRIPSRRPLGAPELVQILLDEKQKIAAFPHSSPWIDVNDVASIGRAEALIAANFRVFELWRQPPHREVVVLGILKEQRIAALPNGNRSGASESGMLPSEEVFQGANGAKETASRLGRQIGLPINALQFLTSFDQLNSGTGERTRHHLFACQLPALGKNGNCISHSTLRWLKLDELSNSHGNSRTLAYLERYAAAQNSHSLGS
jgi:NDP-mannose synthase